MVVKCCLQKFEYGRTIIFVDGLHPLLKGVPLGSQVWMSHGDTISSLPEGYKIIASTHDVECAGYYIENERTYAIQFHPEVYHSTDGKILLKNFLVDICGCSQDWTPVSFVETTVAALKEKLEMIKLFLVCRVE